MKKTKEQDMSCQYCGLENEKKMCVIFGPPAEDCPFSLSGIEPGKMCCLLCYKGYQMLKQSEALAKGAA